MMRKPPRSKNAFIYLAMSGVTKGVMGAVRFECAVSVDEGVNSRDADIRAISLAGVRQVLGIE